MNKQLLRTYLLNILSVADEQIAISNPALTKAAVWNKLIRQCWEDDGEPVDALTLQLFFTEFGSYLFPIRELSTAILAS